VTWPEVAIDSICETTSGGTPSREHPEFYGGGIPWVKSGELRENVILQTEETVSEQAILSSSAKIMPPGTILIAMYGATVGRMATLGIHAATNQAICALRPKSIEIESRFLFHSLQNKIPELLRRRNGGAQPNISQAIIKDLRIGLPSLKDQKRIAAILDKGDTIRRNREQAMRLADEFLRSLFLHLFGDPVLNPKGWPLVEFNNVIESIETGSSVSGEQRPRNPGEKAVLKISAVTWGTFDPLQVKVVESSHLPERLVTPRRGDLLFSRANTRELVAATCIVQSDYPDLFLPDKLWRLSIRGEVATPEYIHFVLSHSSFRKQLTQVATGTSGSMLNISQAKLLRYTLPIPPVNIQREFSKRVDLLTQTRGRIKDSAIAGANLWSSLTDRAFRGDL
jgi:type I restriction enzyme S subunit